MRATRPIKLATLKAKQEIKGKGKMMSQHRVVVPVTVLLFLKGLSDWKKGVRYLSLATILVLAIGLALHRYVWKSSNLDLYTAIAVSVLILLEHVLHVVLASNFYVEFKKMLGFEAKANEEFQEFLEENESEL
jgi:uncharacterized membrane protein YraQ (UPF0718 family)